MNDDSPLIVALDFPTAAEALRLATRLEPEQCRLKVGSELFTRSGPVLVEQLSRRGFDVFLDLKFHDIPNTVAAACRAAKDLGVWMLTVHAQGGRAMLQAARESIDGGPGNCRLVAVTVLTSLDDQSLQEVGVEAPAARQAETLAELCRQCELDGVVCSAREARALRAKMGPDRLLVTPGIRPKASTRDDQRRVVTPAEAVQAGANYLVVGRPITRADDPAEVLRRLLDEVGSCPKSSAL